MEQLNEASALSKIKASSSQDKEFGDQAKVDALGLAFWDARWKQATTLLPQLRLDESSQKSTDMCGGFVVASNRFLVQSPDFLTQAHLSRFMDDEDTDEEVALMGRALLDIGKVTDAVAQQIRAKEQIAIHEVSYSENMPNKLYKCMADMHPPAHDAYFYCVIIVLHSWKCRKRMKPWVSVRVWSSRNPCRSKHSSPSSPSSQFRSTTPSCLKTPCLPTTWANERTSPQLHSTRSAVVR